jgi:hypothetical protein
MAFNCILRAASLKLKGKEFYKRVTEVLRNNFVTICYQIHGNKSETCLTRVKNTYRAVLWFRDVFVITSGFI